jgi:uncharacterized protein
LLEKHGYTFSALSENPTAAGADANASTVDYINAFMITLGFVVIYLLAEKSSVFAKTTLTESSSAVGFFLFGVAASLSSCAALVGGLLLSLSSQWKNNYQSNRSKVLPFVLFNVGRLASFALFGGLLGVFGAFVKPSLLLTSALTIGVLILMILIALQMLGVKQLQKIRFAAPKFITKYVSDENNFSGKYMPFIAGALTFVIPCGFTFIAQTNALATQSFGAGMLRMASFALGTLPMLIFVSIAGISGSKPSKYSKLFNLTSGMLILFFALYSLNSQLNLHGLPSFNDLKTATTKTTKQTVSTKPNTKGIQILKMTAKGFDYSPKEVFLQVDVPVRWEFTNEGVYGCAQTIYARGLYPNLITLKQGLNIIEFTPTTKGTFKISCSMGMVDPVIVHVN